MFQSAKNSKKKGDIGVGIAISYLTTIGSVSIPLTDSQEYDLVVDIDGTLKKVQVKTTEWLSPFGIFQANLAIRGGNRSFNTIKKFDNTGVDYVFVVTSTNKQYFIPSNVIVSKYCLNLGKKYDKYICNALAAKLECVADGCNPST